ncbi:MAG: glycoside hydrolase family 2 protein, partial [Bacteroidota bacterium]|nr:glycoside hydrolase family 2 protein [Bacteroidota bacterium]
MENGSTLYVPCKKRGWTIRKVGNLFPIPSSVYCVPFLSVLWMSSVIAQSSPRIEIPLNDDWRFFRGNFVNAFEISFDDSLWEKVCLPHTWNNLDGQDGGGYYRGPGWYRKHCTISENYSAKRVFVKFGAAGMIADVYVNGRFVGEHRGGFAAFAFDVTGFVSFGKTNLIAVKVDNTSPDVSDKCTVAPLSADFTMDGGLYRTAELIVTNDIHLSLLDYASPGVFLTQKNVTAGSAAVTISTDLRNDSKSTEGVVVKAVIYDRGGRIVAEATGKTRINPMTGKKIDQEATISKPHLWNGRLDPYLYSVVVSVYQQDKLLDEMTQPLGLRYYRVDPEKGFFLNGTPYKLHGFCLHEDKKDKGRAITDDDRREEMNDLLDIGATMVRLAHYQHGEAMYRLCDENGVAVWTEIPLIDYIVDSKSFAENCRQQLLELIRQNYNHPSIFFWGIFNEIENAKGPDPVPLVKDLNALAKKEDPTRLTTSAANMNDLPAAFVTDVLGLNKYFGWYGGNVRELGPYLDRWHNEHPGRAIGLSEYGAGGSIYQHEEVQAAGPLAPEHPRTNGPWHPEEYQAYFHEQSWNTIEERQYVWFSTVWNGFDFASDSRREGFQPGINDKGLITQDHSTKKDSYYWYKVQWNPSPMVYITGKRFTKRDTSLISVKVYSNAP